MSQGHVTLLGHDCIKMNVFPSGTYTFVVVFFLLPLHNIKYIQKPARDTYMAGKNVARQVREVF